MSHVRVTVSQGIVACSPSLPEMVSVALRPLEDVVPLTVQALDKFRLRDKIGTAKVGLVSGGVLEVHAELEDVVRAVLRGLHTRIETQVFRGEEATVRSGNAPE
ncbi:MAG: hypothetical protein HY909_11880 [Deltaproteobacteria bacterium]|nr:hypothetical protein [Deltaproteobacteria bacterium]